MCASACCAARDEASGSATTLSQRGTVQLQAHACTQARDARRGDGEQYENCGKTPLKNALKKYRKAEEEDVDAAIADFEEGVEHEG